jgi:hypothetical protein
VQQRVKEIKNRALSQLPVNSIVSRSTIDQQNSIATSNNPTHDNSTYGHVSPTEHFANQAQSKQPERLAENPYINKQDLQHLATKSFKYEQNRMLSLEAKVQDMMDQRRNH